MRAFAAPSAASSVPQSAEAVFDEGGVYLLVLSARRTSDGADLGVKFRRLALCLGAGHHGRGRHRLGGGNVPHDDAYEVVVGGAIAE
jgi:hypothetical protein